MLNIHYWLTENLFKNDQTSFYLFFLSFQHFFSVSFFSRINEGKERDEPKAIPLKIFAKDIGNCAYVSFFSFFPLASPALRSFCVTLCFLQAKTLSVNNSDSTDDVIRMALQQFGISVSMNSDMLLHVCDHEWNSFTVCLHSIHCW